METSLTWERLESYSIAPRDPFSLKHAGLVRLLEQLQEYDPDFPQLVCLGNSVEGRAIHRLDLGQGPKRILLWSQMHGDEPTHTAALLDLVHYLQRARRDPSVESILAGCQLQLIPMLNPDGAERALRQNADGIDINRDARDLRTPEGRILYQAVDTFQPNFAFNLHNQNPRNYVELTGKPAAVSWMVPPIDRAGSVPDQILAAKKVVACFRHAVAGTCPEHMGRYDADYMHDAFGETVQQRGAVTVLVEAGGWPEEGRPSLTRIHEAGLFVTLAAIATDTYLDFDPQDYDALPRTVSCGAPEINLPGKDHAQ